MNTIKSPIILGLLVVLTNCGFDFSKSAAKDPENIEAKSGEFEFSENGDLSFNLNLPPSSPSIAPPIPDSDNTVIAVPNSPKSISITCTSSNIDIPPPGNPYKKIPAVEESNTTPIPDTKVYPDFVRYVEFVIASSSGELINERVGFTCQGDARVSVRNLQMHSQYTMSAKYFDAMTGDIYKGVSDPFIPAKRPKVGLFMKLHRPITSTVDVVMSFEKPEVNQCELMWDCAENFAPTICRGEYTTDQPYDEAQLIVLRQEGSNACEASFRLQQLACEKNYHLIEGSMVCITDLPDDVPLDRMH